MTYGCMASMKTRAGSRDDVVSILLSAVDGLREQDATSTSWACSEDDDVTIWVTEFWRTKEHHDASLELPEAKAAISKAVPMLTGEFTKQELSVVGGLGL